MDQLLTPADVAEQLQKPEKTLANWRSQGIGPKFLKLENGSIRYEPAAVSDWLASFRVSA